MSCDGISVCLFFEKIRVTNVYNYNGHYAALPWYISPGKSSKDSVGKQNLLVFAST